MGNATEHEYGAAEAVATVKSPWGGTFHFIPVRCALSRVICGERSFVERICYDFQRRFTGEYKAHILLEADTCVEPGEIRALLRREGRITASYGVAAAAGAGRAGRPGPEAARPGAAAPVGLARARAGARERRICFGVARGSPSYGRIEFLTLSYPAAAPMGVGK